VEVAAGQAVVEVLVASAEEVAEAAVPVEIIKKKSDLCKSLFFLHSFELFSKMILKDY
jgi:hypothetical protein